MDAKISEFPVAATVSVSAIIPVVVDGVNKGLTVGVLALNMPNFGNKGITKNTVVQAVAAPIPLTGTVYALASLGVPYTLSNGSDGQELTLVSNSINDVIVSSGFMSTIGMVVGSSITLLFMNSLSKWVVKSQYNCTVA